MTDDITIHLCAPGYEKRSGRKNSTSRSRLNRIVTSDACAGRLPRGCGGTWPEY